MSEPTLRTSVAFRGASAAFACLLLLFAPAALDAQLCDFSGTASAGSAQVIVQYEVDVAAGLLNYSIAAQGLGTILDAEIFRAAALFLDLNPVGIAGTACGTVQSDDADFADFVNDPEDYTTTITGTDTSVDVVVELVGECLNFDALAPVDLQLLRVKAKNKLKATVRNLSATDSEITVVRFFQSIDDTFDNDDLFFAEARLRSVKPNKKKKAKTANRGGESGEFFVIACADPLDFNDDPDPTNNCLATNNPVEFD